jgi:very-short-patch-repair endonuclease
MSDEILAQTAKRLRKNSTDAEKALWLHLRAKQFRGVKFRRQAPIGRYVVDFVCHARKLVIEVDGGQHAADKSRDQERELWLTEQGYSIMRFWNNEILENIEGVLEKIEEKLSPSPSPSHQGRGKSGRHSDQ